MSRLVANGPQRIFSPTGEFMAWDTLFLQKASVPTLKHYISHPNDALAKKPKRPDNFVIALEEGPPGMSTPSAGSKQALYKQALDEYRTQHKLHAALQEWMKTTLHPNLYKACCIPGQTAFQWRTNLIGRITQMQLEPSNSQEIRQVNSDAQKRDHGSVAADDDDDEPPRKKHKGAKREARRQREETMAHQISTLEEEVRRLSALNEEVDRLKTLVSNFQVKVTSLESGYGSGSAMTRKFTSPLSESFSMAESAPSWGSGSDSDDGSATPGSDEDEPDGESEEGSEDDHGNKYTSSPPVSKRGGKAGSMALSSSTAHGSESSSDEEVDNYMSLPPPRIVQQRPLNLAHAVGTEMLSEDYTSSPPIPMIDRTRFAIPAPPILGTITAPKDDQDQSNPDIEDAAGSSDMDDGESGASDVKDESGDQEVKFESESDEGSGDESSDAESEDGTTRDCDDDVKVKVEDVITHHVKAEPVDVYDGRGLSDDMDSDASDGSVSGSESGSVSGSDEGSVSDSNEGSVSASDGESVSASDEGSVSGSDIGSQSN